MIDCITPIMQGTAQRPKAAKPLPQVDAEVMQACKSANPNFGQQEAPVTHELSTADLGAFLDPLIKDQLARLKVDLRLGVATAGQANAQARELQVLKVCLAEVRRCRPFLIVLLGDRYGWIPPAERVTAAAAEERFEANVIGCSVTELEIRYGVLADSAQQPRSYFYFREPLAYDDMPRHIAAQYSDAHDASAGASDRAMRLLALKREIEQTLPKRVRRYTVGWDRQRRAITDLGAWGRAVLEDIWSDILAVTPPPERER